MQVPYFWQENQLRRERVSEKERERERERVRVTTMTPNMQTKTDKKFCSLVCMFQAMVWVMVLRALSRGVEAKEVSVV